jgi:hypothetical protein
MVALPYKRVAISRKAMYGEDKMILNSSRFISFIYRYWYPVAATAE